MPPESHPSSTVTSVEGEDRTGKERIQMGATRYLSTKSSPYSFAYTDVQLCNCSQTPYSVHTHLLNYTQFLRDGQQWALQVYNMQLFHSSSLNTTKLLKLRKKKKREKREEEQCYPCTYKLPEEQWRVLQGVGSGAGWSGFRSWLLTRCRILGKLPDLSAPNGTHL